MKPSRIALFSAAQLVAAYAMFPTLTPPEPVRRHRARREPTPYHREGHDAVLMDWDFPKGKRAKRRARGRHAISHPNRGDPA